ncbi:MAG: sortase [bacterium]|nr:sortase [bacterium]
MKIKKQFKLKLGLIFLVAVLGAGYYFLFLKPDPAGNTLADNTFGWQFPVAKFPITGPGPIAYSDIRDPGGIPEGLPVRLQIPSIGVESAIEDALITPEGRMDVPAGSLNVAWFALGPHPGQVGSAVIGGHYGIRNSIPFVFYKLDQVKVGDKVYVIDDKGDTKGFVVRSIKLFERNADATTVFTSNDGLAHLNIITCEGIWNKVNDTYPLRRVVFTDAIPEEGVSAGAPAASTFYRILSVGEKGEDVLTLQNILEKKGFLTMPFGVAKGYFGGLTRVALAKYQTSVGLPSVGILGPLTRAKLNAEQSPVTAIPALPLTAIDQAESPFSKTAFFNKDILITLLLLWGIFFVVFKIISS